jgi:hypothetical protein
VLRRYYPGAQMVSHLPPPPPQPVQIMVPKPLQSRHFSRPGPNLPEPPQFMQRFLPLLQNVHCFHTRLLDIMVSGSCGFAF